MSINNILDAIKIEMNEAEEGMEAADSDDFLFCGAKLATLFDLSRELSMIQFSKGRTVEELIPILRGRVDAIQTVITLIHKEKKNESAKEND